MFRKYQDPRVFKGFKELRPEQDLRHKILSQESHDDVSSKKLRHEEDLTLSRKDFLIPKILRKEPTQMFAEFQV